MEDAKDVLKHYASTFREELEAKPVMQEIGDIFPRSTRQEIERAIDREGDHNTIHLILEKLPMRDNWVEVFYKALKGKNINKPKLAELFEDFVNKDRGLDESHSLGRSYTLQTCIEDIPYFLKHWETLDSRYGLYEGMTVGALMDEMFVKDKKDYKHIKKVLRIHHSYVRQATTTESLPADFNSNISTSTFEVSPLTNTSMSLPIMSNTDNSSHVQPGVAPLREVIYNQEQAWEKMARNGSLENPAQSVPTSHVHPSPFTEDRDLTASLPTMPAPEYRKVPEVVEIEKKVPEVYESARKSAEIDDYNNERPEVDENENNGPVVDDNSRSLPTVSDAKYSTQAEPDVSPLHEVFSDQEKALALNQSQEKPAQSDPSNPVHPSPVTGDRDSAESFPTMPAPERRFPEVDESVKVSREIDDSKNEGPVVDENENNGPVVNTIEKANPIVVTIEEASPLIDENENNGPVFNTIEKESPVIVTIEEASFEAIDENENNGPVVDTIEKASPVVLPIEKASPLIDVNENNGPVVDTIEEAVAVVDPMEEAVAVDDESETEGPVFDTTVVEVRVVDESETESPVIDTIEEEGPAVDESETEEPGVDVGVEPANSSLSSEASSATGTSNEETSSLPLFFGAVGLGVALSFTFGFFWSRR